MYSVLRIGEIEEPYISEIISEFNRLLPGFCSDKKEDAEAIRVEDLYSFSLSEKTPWHENREEVLRILQILKPALEYAKSCGAEFEVDIAIYETDYHGRNMTMFSAFPSMMEFFSDLNIILTFSLYTVGIDWSKNPP